jgi:hypothetical protein
MINDGRACKKVVQRGVVIIVLKSIHGNRVFESARGAGEEGLTNALRALMAIAFLRVREGQARRV